MLRQRLDTLHALAIQIQAELASAQVDLNDASSHSSDEDVYVRPPADDRSPPTTSPHPESERRDDACYPDGRIERAVHGPELNDIIETDSPLGFCSDTSNGVDSSTGPAGAPSMSLCLPRLPDIKLPQSHSSPGPSASDVAPKVMFTPSTLTSTVHDVAAGSGNDASGTSTPAARRPSRLPRLNRSASGSASASARPRGRPQVRITPRSVLDWLADAQVPAQETVSAQREIIVELLSGMKISRPNLVFYEIHITKNPYVLRSLEKESGGAVPRVAIPLPDLSEAEAAALGRDVRVQAAYPMDESDDPWHHRHVRIGIRPVDDEAEQLLEFGFDGIPTARERLYLDYCSWSRWVLRASQSVRL